MEMATAYLKYQDFFLNRKLRNVPQRLGAQYFGLFYLNNNSAGFLAWALYRVRTNILSVGSGLLSAANLQRLELSSIQFLG